ncbi:uncharacterized protein LOC131891080 isoform X1 [Tigriopus californicus]|uniref:uncharacterized protein LOC131891080 isoform X1 n=1 Tax=Tigriopus californicus TaxID=6832 RepID=UPI0027DA7C34|nr:uncharacterized protein LOC131891080 isoform X1 [Tigriopus californicus]
MKLPNCLLCSKTTVLIWLSPVFLSTLWYLVDRLWESAVQTVEVKHVFEEIHCSNVFNVSSNFSTYRQFNPKVISTKFLSSQTNANCLDGLLSNCRSFSVIYDEFLEHVPIRISNQGRYITGVHENSRNFVIMSNTETCFRDWIRFCTLTNAVALLADAPEGCHLLERIEVHVPRILTVAAKAEAVKQRTDVHGRMSDFFTKDRFSCVENAQVTSLNFELLDYINNVWHIE